MNFLERILTLLSPSLRRCILNTNLRSNATLLRLRSQNQHSLSRFHTHVQDVHALANQMVRRNVYATAEFCRIFANNEPTVQQLTRAVAKVRRNEAHLFPQQLIDVMQLDDPHYLRQVSDDASARLQSLLTAPPPAVANPVAEQITDDSAEHAMDELEKLFACILCGGVTAAPMKSNCGHISCYTCISDHLSEHTHCPADNCTNLNMLIPRFQETLDAHIASLIANIGDCERKDIWSDDRALYFEHLRIASVTENQNAEIPDGGHVEEKETFFSFDKEVLRSYMLGVYMMLIVQALVTVV